MLNKSTFFLFGYLGIIHLFMLAGFGSMLFGQSVRSPYSTYGIGEFTGHTLPHHQGLGGGLALPTVSHVNTLNPALLAYYRFTHIQLGASGDGRWLQKGTVISRSNFVNFSGLHIATPIIANRWGMGFGIRPHTQVGYRSLVSSPVAGATVVAKHALESRGGLNEGYMGHGFHLGKGFYVGVQGGYLFGFIHKSDKVTLDEEVHLFFQTDRAERTYYQGFRLKTGVQYAYQFGNRVLSIGGVYAPNLSITAREYLEINRNNLATGGLIALAEERIVEKYAYTLPTEWGLGLAYEQGVNLRTYLDISGRAFSANSGYVSHWGVRGGVEVRFRPFRTNYFGRLPYRLGFSWQQLPYVGAGDDRSVYLGLSLPIRNTAQIDLAARAGLRGKDVAQYTRETYVSFSIGTTFTNKWFIKRRYD